jgi:S1-C subfamily serine protease
MVVGSLIVCDGDVDVQAQVVDSVVVARGTIKVPSILQNSALLCGGDLDSPAIVADSTIVTRGKVRARVGGSSTQNSVVKQGERKPLWGITFFDQGQLGIELEPDAGVVKVKAVRDGKPFARAGVKKDDVVTHICGVKADSLRTCRRLLRDALEDRGAVLQVRRGEKQLEVTVGLEE